MAGMEYTWCGMCGTHYCIGIGHVCTVPPRFEPPAFQIPTAPVCVALLPLPTLLDEDEIPFAWEVSDGG
jgi:hypothetical protein